MYTSLKRLFDLIVSLICILIVAPFFIFIWILIKADSPKDPTIYKGKRASMNAGIFYLYKFRTMVVDAESLGGYSTAIDDPRLTKLGKLLRKFKIDEIPQLLNVIRGEMSLVGPRPQVTFYTDKYTLEQKQILKVKPGITDISSLLFIDMDKTLGNVDVDEVYEAEIEPVKNKLRLEYANNASFGLDLVILIVTFIRIFGLNELNARKIILFFYPNLDLETR